MTQELRTVPLVHEGFFGRDRTFDAPLIEVKRRTVVLGMPVHGEKFLVEREFLLSNGFEYTPGSACMDDNWYIDRKAGVLESLRELPFTQEADALRNRQAVDCFTVAEFWDWIKSRPKPQHSAKIPSVPTMAPEAFVCDYTMTNRVLHPLPWKELEVHVGSLYAEKDPDIEREGSD